MPATLITVPVIIFVIMTQGVITATIVFSVYEFVAGLADNVLKPLLLGRGVAVFWRWVKDQPQPERAQEKQQA